MWNISAVCQPAHRHHFPAALALHYNRTMTDALIIAGREFRSRLIVGTGKYKSGQETAEAIEASGAEMESIKHLAA